jgi:hypothetical protein
MNAARAIITLLTLPILFLAALRPALAADELPPNLIVVFCDNLGYGDDEPF